MKKKLFYLFSFIVLLVGASSFSRTFTSKVKKGSAKVSQQDTVKKANATVEADSIIVYKGKFKPYKTKTHASYYNNKFNGRRTASGKIYDKNKLTAAHKKLPFGTIVRVTNEANGKSVIVEITDRGPFVKGREIDLSRKAFMSIVGNKNSGSIIATLEVLQK
jgi:rare lipoprotein A